MPWKNGIFIPESQQKKIDVGLSSDTEGINDINKISQKEIDKAKASSTVKLADGTISKPGTPTKSTSTVKAGDDIPIWEEMGMTREQYINRNLQRGEQEAIKAGVEKPAGTTYDPYAALQDRQMRKLGGEDVQAVSPFIAEGRATAIRDRYQAEAGDQPTMPDTSEMTDEQRLQAEADYNSQLANWYKKVGEAQSKDLGDVQTQMANVEDQLAQYKGAMDDMVATLNTSNPELGSALSEAFAEIGESGGSITPEKLAAIQQLAESNPDPDTFKTQVSAMLSSSVNPGVLSAGGVTDNGSNYTLSNGISFPKGAGGGIDFDPSNLDPSTNAYDIALMEYMLNKQTTDVGLMQELRRLQDLSKTVQRAQATSKAEADMIAQEGYNATTEAKIAVMNEQAYQKRKLELEKDWSLDNILEEEAQMEGFMKGQLEAWGASDSSAALSVMGNIKNKFLKQYTQTAQGYDLELSRVSDKITEANLAYTNRMIEIANRKNVTYEKINNNILDSIQDISTGTKEAYENKDLKYLSASTNYFKTIQGLKQAEAEAKREAVTDSRDFSFDLMKEYADQTGFQHKIVQDDEGYYGVEQVLDANGYPIPLAGKSSSSSTILGGGTQISTGGSSGTVPLAQTTEYLTSLNSDWINSTGTGQVMTGSPWKDGLDIDGRIGDPITAPTGGTIVRVVNDFQRQQPPYNSQKGFGNNVLLKTDDGRLIQFSHLDSASVNVGDRVTAGQSLGALGNTGFVIPGEGGDGSHVDVTMWKSMADAGMTKEEAIAKGNPSALPPVANVGAMGYNNNSTVPQIDVANYDLNTTGINIAKSYYDLLKSGKTWEDGDFGNTLTERNAKNAVETELKNAGYTVPETTQKYTIQDLKKVKLGNIDAYTIYKGMKEEGASDSEMQDFFNDVRSELTGSGYEDLLQQLNL